MLRHVFKIVWNRKKANGLVALEIFFSFLVLIGVLTMAVVGFSNVRAPLGFETKDVWSVRIDDRRGGEPGSMPVQELLDAARALPQVARVGATQNLPYSNMTIRDGVELHGRHVMYDFAAATDDFAGVLGLQLSRGRWFTREDDGAREIATVLNAKAAKDLFGNEDPIGKLVPEEERRGNDPAKLRRRVVGVLSAYRVEGAYQDPRGYAFMRHDARNGAEEAGPLLLAVRVRPGTPRTFEAALVKALHMVAPTMTFTVEPFAEMKAFSDRQTLMPFVFMGVLCAFLLLMVALGLTGVLWESVTRRTREIGVRRAVGASGAVVARQIVLEICAVTTFAVLLGALFAGQLPILHLMGDLSPVLFATGLLAAVVALYGLATACGLYPGWLATRVLPSQALRDE